MPIFYECERCTACCRWPGEVRVTDSELEQLASHLRITAAEFIGEFTRINHQRTGLVLAEQPSGACIFLEGVDCKVQPVKPQQCRDFPNLWNFPGFDRYCRAKPLEVSEIEWRQRLMIATGRASFAKMSSD